MEKKDLFNHIKDLKRAVKNEEPDVSHKLFDDIAFDIARRAQPELMKKLDKIVKGTAFWYA